MSDVFDLVVIGSGPAGEKGAAQAAYFNKTVAIVEETMAPGGIAVSSAGIPSKTLRETALYVSGFRHRELYGLGLKLEPEVALECLMARKAEVVSLMTGAVARNIARHDIEMIRGRARLGPHRTVHVTLDHGRERVLQAGVILLAPGSHVCRPAGVPFDDPDVHDPEAILTLDRIPGSLVVVGGGSVGCEYASIFAALGVSVTLVDHNARLLRYLDPEMSEGLARAFESMGMRVVLNARLGRVGRAEGRLEVSLATGERFYPEKVLFATGRAGNTEGLGLEGAGVAVNDRGDILVDEHFQTLAPGIYAAGDVIGPPRLASVSMEQARVAVCHAFNFKFKDMVDRLAPHCVYSIPEVAMVGMSEAQAAAAGIEYEIGRGLFSANAKAKISGFDEGMVKLVFRRDDRVLLGVHILGEMASELIHLGQFVLHERAPIDRFIHATFAVPTRSDAYKYAAYDGLMRLDRRIGVFSTARLDVAETGRPLSQ